MSRISFVAPVFGPVQVSSKAIFKKCPAVRMSTDTLEEHFDVLQADGSPAGYSKARSLVHRDGDWHRSTHIWVLSNDGRLLVQKRSSLKDTFPVRSYVKLITPLATGLLVHMRIVSCGINNLFWNFAAGEGEMGRFSSWSHICW